MAKKERIPKTALEVAAIVFPEEQVGPYRFRPWGLDQFDVLIPILMRLIPELEAAQIPPEQYETRVFEIVPILTPFLPVLIGVTLGLAPGEYEQIAIGHRAALGLRILINPENMAQIKNFLTGLMGGSQSPVKTL